MGETRWLSEDEQRTWRKLVAVLMKRPTPFVRTFTENLMAYALGRRVEYFDQPAIRSIARAAETHERARAVGSRCLALA